MQLGGAIEGQTDVVLPSDLRRGFDPQSPDDVTLDVESEDVGRVQLSFGAIVRQFHSAGLAPSANLDLGLYRRRIAETFSGGDCVRDRIGNGSFRDGDRVSGEDLLALVLVEIQPASPSTSSIRADLAPPALWTTGGFQLEFRSLARC